MIFQVVLVDDASDMAHLGEPLDSYISRWRGKVELVRSGEKDGQVGLFQDEDSILLRAGGRVNIFRWEGGTCQGSASWS